MAKIENTKRQIEALDIVTHALQEIRLINLLLNHKGSLTLTRTEDGKKSYSVLLDPQYEIHAEKILNKQKQALIRKVNKAVKGNHIVLSEEEQNLLICESDIVNTETPSQE